MSIMMAGCSESKTETTSEKEMLSPCSKEIGGIQFSQARNGAENCVRVWNDTLEFRAGAQTDYFRSPSGSVVNTSPVLLTEVDNTKPFTFTAKVEPKFTEIGTYSAGVLYAYENETHW